MQNELTHHTDNEKEMRKDKVNQKQEYDRDEMQNIGEIEDREKELEQNLDDVSKQLDLRK